ncbi:DeoR/GlpR family DNA-binding transcription regulator [Clostridium sp. SYSU_GA19001]|uniref:DeoR/GlpR family DNA-binding transcription regulator n=1 Tax=Clostridium caldaquaticum TaxID=2940653 RepID=UPI002076F22C|nr:DeoR/GlpR family DNA-binding transcription regulator [Clostridium caldaquaticum]MCM8711180.1 DeoR/GlpR family DNA-binding transcription regulator [Clostridium caldaquaticum]
MFAPERIRIIKGILSDKKHINVSDLSTMLNVSEVTIRRDLEKLEGEGFLTRTHGGAILNDNNLSSNDDYADIEADPYVEQRIEISEIASHMVDDNDVIILSSGVTNLYIAKKILNKKNLTVLTNDLNIASEFSASSNTKVIIPGGDLDLSSMTLVGKLTEENLKNFFVSKAFIEVEGVSMQRGYTVQSMDKASVIKEMLNITREKIIVCPYTCFDTIAFSQIGALNLANKVITNPSIPDLYKKYYFESNIQLFTAFNSYEGGM